MIHKNTLYEKSILLRYFSWFDRLSKEEQKTVADHFRSIMEVVQK